MSCPECDRLRPIWKAGGNPGWRTGVCYDCAGVTLSDDWMTEQGINPADLPTLPEARASGARKRGGSPKHMLPGRQAPAHTLSRAVMASRETEAGEDVDFFPTRPWGSRAGGEIIRQLDPRARSVEECAVGVGMMAHGLADYFPVVHGSDVCVYDPDLYAARGWRQRDFLTDSDDGLAPDWIVTNPPFDHVEAFIERALVRARRGVAMLLRLACISGQARHRLLHGDVGLTVFAPFSERLPMHRGFWDPTRTTATDYAWFIWCKPGVGPRLPVICGQRRPLIFDIPPGTEDRLTRPEDAALFAAALPPLSLEGPPS